MGIRHQQVGIAIAISAVAGVVACTGGGGSYSSDFETWDSPPVSQENGGNTRESPPRSVERAATNQEGAQRSFENAPGAQGVGGPGGAAAATPAFDCSGSYRCTQSDGKKTSTIVLSNAGGKCAAVDAQSQSASSVVLESDGRLTLGNIPVGSWAVTANGFSVTVDKTTSTCVKGSATQTGSSTSSSSSSSSSSTGGSTSGNPNPPG